MLGRMKSLLVVCVLVSSVGLPANTAASSPARDAALADAPTTVVFGDGDVQPLVPARLLDTRDGSGGISGKIGPGSTTVLQVAGRGGVPAVGVGAVVLNVTVTEPTTDSYVTVFPTGVSAPLASNLNVTAQQTVPNLVVAKVGVGGKVSFFNNSGEAHLVVDVSGWFPEGSGLQPLSPIRALDTRSGNGAAVGPIKGGSTVRLKVAGRAGVPAQGAAAVVLNVTVTEPTANGYVTVFPSGSARPLASNLNFTPGLTVPNLVIAKVGPDGAVNLFNSAGSTHLIADVAGWFPASSALTSVAPSRLLDTREGNGAPAGTVGPGSVTRLQITGRNEVPAGIGAVVLNMTVTEPTAAGYITVYPTGVERPTASNLNMRPGQTVPNLVIAKVGADGAVNIFNSAGNSHLVADVVGWFRAAGDNQTRLELRPGTVLVGSGDVVSVVPSGATGFTVVLSASSDKPVVGGHLAVSQSAAVPDGAFGSVTSVTVNDDGTSVVQLNKATLETGFADIDSNFNGPIDFSPLPAVALPTEAELECKGVGGVEVSGDVTFGGFSGLFQMSLRQRHLTAILHGQIVVTMHAAVSVALSCRISGPLKVRIPAGPAVLGLSWGFTVALSASMEASATATFDATIGFVANGSDLQNRTHFEFSGGGTLASEVSAQMSVGPNIEFDASAYGIVGVSIKTGIDFTGTYLPPDCVKMSVGVTVEIAFKVGDWGLEWRSVLATKKFGPWELLRSEGCNANAWVGTIAVSQSMTEGSAVIPDTLTYTYSRNYGYTVTSTTTSLLGGEPYTNSTPGGVNVTGVSGTEHANQDYANVVDPPCNDITSTISAPPWWYLGAMFKTPGGEPTVNPPGGSTVYLLIEPNLSSQAACADGSSLGDPDLLGLYSPGKIYGGQGGCFNGYVEHNGGCFLTATVSADGNHIVAYVVGSASYAYYPTGDGNYYTTHVGQTVQIDLARI